MTSAAIIDEIGVRLARVAPRDSRVVLFGSHARGEAEAGSDYAILVIEPVVADAARESVRLRSELGDLLVPIDVVVIDRERARRRAAVRGTMVERALREGRILPTPEVLQTVDRRAYSDGVRILKRAAKAARAAGLDEDFTIYISRLREQYRRRPTLMTMLDKAGFA